MSEQKREGEVRIGYWDDKTFEVALWKSKRRGQQQADGRVEVFILRTELDNLYPSVNLENFQEKFKVI